MAKRLIMPNQLLIVVLKFSFYENGEEKTAIRTDLARSADQRGVL